MSNEPAANPAEEPAPEGDWVRRSLVQISIDLINPTNSEVYGWPLSAAVYLGGDADTVLHGAKWKS